MIIKKMELRTPIFTLFIKQITKISYLFLPTADQLPVKQMRSHIVFNINPEANK